ncbi:MAG: hypothetical protein FWC50_15215 [Planctomycetaceae bacterium]|nr:hypothetical protein [Planctomycetaceae bacterium]
MTELTILDELKNLLPPLTAEEFAGLEESILKDGCLSPLVVWDGTLVDGHSRYAICMKHGIPFSVKNIDFASLDAAKFWAWKYQDHRRNLTPFQRVELALKFKDAFAKKAKERQGRAGGRGGNRVEGVPINTVSQLAIIARVSRDTIRKAEHIASFADEETKNRLRRGDKGTSIHREYKRLKPDNTTPVPVVNEPVVLPEWKNVMEDEAGTLFIHKDTTPEELAAFLVANYSVEFICDFIHCFMNLYQSRYGQEATQHFLLKLSARFID